MSNKRLRSELTEIIMRRDFFLSGDEFTSSDMASNLDMDKSTAHAALVAMYHKSLIDRRETVHNNNVTIFWSKKGTNWNRIGWRFRQDWELGINPVVGSREWSLEDIAKESREVQAHT